MPTRSRFHAVNPSAVRTLRRQLGWSQAELGKRAGYCERVIRKAEAGGSLSISTIENLVQTFVTHNLSVTTRELIYSEESLARIFLGSYDAYGRSMLQHCDQFLCENFILNIPAAKSVLQIAGEYAGKQTFQSFLENYFRHFTRQTSSLTPTYLVAKGRVVAYFEEQLRYMDTALPSIWVNMHFFFQSGQISRVDAQFDYALAIKAIEEISASKASSRSPSLKIAEESRRLESTSSSNPSAANLADDMPEDVQQVI